MIPGKQTRETKDGWHPDRSDLYAVLSILAIGVLIYGLYVPLLGYYWDDWPTVWVFNALGPTGVAKYFAGQRPVYGWLYGSLAPILGLSPIGWHVLALIFRSAASAALYVGFCALWPNRKDVAWMIGVLVLIYPGYSLQPIALSLFQYQISFFCIAVSLTATILFFAMPAYRWLFLLIALLSGGFSYLIIEYFLGLEFFRFCIIVFLTWRTDAKWNVEKLKAALLIWSPFVAIWATYLIWRTFFFRVVTFYGNAAYMDIGLDASQLLRHPIHGIAVRLVGAIHNILLSTIFAAARPFNPDLINFETHVWLRAWTIAALVIGIGFFMLRRIGTAGTQIPASERGDAPSNFSPKAGLILGVAGLIVAGVPFAGSDLRAAFTEHPSFADRWTLPYMIPASLVLACLFTFLDKRRVSRTIWIVVILFGFSAFQVQNEVRYHDDWRAQKSLFWQLAWRAPALKPGTVVFADGVPRSLFGNHTVGMLNLLYNSNDSSGQLDYFMFDLSRPELWKPYAGNVSYRYGAPISGRVRSFQFQGTTAQSVELSVLPNGTLHIITPSSAEEALRCSGICTNIAELSQPEISISDTPGLPGGPLLKIFGAAEAKDRWRYYYQRAELERQLKNWTAVAALGDEAIRQGYQPADLSEWFPFIDGYARSGRFQTAADLTKKMLGEDPDALLPLSSLWNRVQQEGAAKSPEMIATLRDLNDKLVLGDVQVR